ncbi:MAG: amino acid adenylation domain-containing protein, partial [Acidobacteriota bacterium]
MSCRLKELPILCPEERSTQLIAWNGREPERRGESSLLERMERVSRANPDSVAALGADGHLSYGGLHRCANRWARFLRTKGAGPEALVGLCLGRSADAVAVILGILKSGGAYVALDPQSPPQRLHQIIEETGLLLLLCQGAMKANLQRAGLGCALVDIAAAKGGLRAQPAGRLDPGLEPENLAYLLMTSGSSGRPKGVMVSHGNLLNSTLNRIDFYSGRAKRFLLLSPLFFDSSVAGLYWTLAQGGCLVLPQEGQQRDVNLMRELCECEHISHLLCIPSLYGLLIEELKGCRQLSLEKVIVAGEVCWAEMAARHTEAFEGIELFNEYGPTEGTVWSTVCRIDGANPEDPVPIGRSTGSIRTYLLDEQIQLLPAGGQGEIYCGGSGIARGYCSRSAETAERFIPDAFGEVLGGRLYRSGDRGRWRGDGQLLYEGRSDDEVKIRGYRIALGEVESVLKEHPEVEEAAVVMVKGGAQAQLIGFAVLTKGAGQDHEGLRAYMRKRLPEPMMPTRVHLLSALPQSPNGKLDRERLQALEGEFQDVGAGASAAKGPVENLIADAWSEVLARENVGLDEDFFAIGGHSLLATQVVSRIQTIFGYALSLQNLFENPTVRKLAELIKREKDIEQIELAAPAITAVSRDGQTLPLSLQQQRLWFLCETNPGSVDYNLPRALRLKGPLDRGALEGAIREIMRRHHVLRASCFSAEGRPFMRLHAADGWELAVEDVEPVSPQSLMEAVEARIHSEVEKPFDLSKGLMRILLFRCGLDDHVLFFNMHQIISDGWSLGILLGELRVLYDAYSRGKSSPLPELTLSYADYADWQRQWMRGEVLERFLDFWEAALQGMPQGLALPFKPGAPTEERLAGRSLHF